MKVLHDKTLMCNGLGTLVQHELFKIIEAVNSNGRKRVLLELKDLPVFRETLLLQRKNDTLHTVC